MGHGSRQLEPGGLHRTAGDFSAGDTVSPIGKPHFDPRPGTGWLRRSSEAHLPPPGTSAGQSVSSGSVLSERPLYARKGTPWSILACRG
jgi:hypothetical protein